MKLTIAHQEKYSRAQLILRRLFGLVYIAVPHVVLLAIVGVWLILIRFLSFWVVLYTGRFPEGFFNFHIDYLNWYLRVAASIGIFGGYGNLVDGYPPFFPGLRGDCVKLEVSRPDHVNRWIVIARLFFGTIYVRVPHFICLFFREIASGIVAFLAWWVILFTGRYPQRWHAFNVGTYRWATRVYLYLSYLSDEYPRFTGKE